MELNHPKYHQHLQSLMRTLSKELMGPVSGFTQLHARSMAEGVLSAKVKELMALSIAICVRCDGCIAYHRHAY